MTLNGAMAVTLRNFTEFGKPALQKTIGGGIYKITIVFLVRVQCRRKESSRSLYVVAVRLSSVCNVCALVMSRYTEIQNRYPIFSNTDK